MTYGVKTKQIYAGWFESQLVKPRMQQGKMKSGRRCQSVAVPNKRAEPHRGPGCPPSTDVPIRSAEVYSETGDRARFCIVRSAKVVSSIWYMSDQRRCDETRSAIEIGGIRQWRIPELINVAMNVNEDLLNLIKIPGIGPLGRRSKSCAVTIVPNDKRDKSAHQSSVVFRTENQPSIRSRDHEEHK